MTMMNDVIKDAYERLKRKVERVVSGYSWTNKDENDSKLE
jgi:hypothetical protein